MANLSGDRL